jgi:hypothetical protein
VRVDLGTSRADRRCYLFLYFWTTPWHTISTFLISSSFLLIAALVII